MRSFSCDLPRRRSQVHCTSLAVKGLPSCHFTPSRSLKVSRVSSSLHDQLVASCGRPAEACRAAVVPAAAVGRVLAGGEPGAGTGARPVLGRAARPEPQGDALAPGAVALGDLPAADAG